MMNWSVALPEIVLALCALAILIAGVMQRRDTTLLCTMGAIAACLVTAVLVTDMPTAVGFGGFFLTDAFAKFAKLLILAGLNSPQRRLVAGL